MSDRGAAPVGAPIHLPLLGTVEPPDDGASAGARDPSARFLVDAHGRVVTDLRLSITDRCNLRCVYCLDPGARFAPPHALLSVDELSFAAEACASLGIRHLRITGGEPTLHPELVRIIASVAALPLDDCSMTTNGALASRQAIRRWRDAGLRRLTFSLDAVSERGFAAMTRSRTPVGAVIDAIRDAIDLGLTPVKVNAVVLRGRNEDEVEALAALARDTGFEMRFIEYMPLDSGRHWEPGLLVPASEIVALASRAGALRPTGRDAANSTSESFEFAGRAAPGARIGVIAPVTRPFCGACSRLRITADGRVRPCLFSLGEFDLREALRDPPSAPGERARRRRVVEELILDAVWVKQAGHGIRERGFRQPARSMSAIGG